MSGFAGETGGKFESASLRWGIQRIIALYLDRQGKIINDFVKRFEGSDITSRTTSFIEAWLYQSLNYYKNFTTKLK